MLAIPQRCKKLTKSKKGFTLIELIVVIVILAILASIAMPALKGISETAEDAVSETNIKILHKGVLAALATEWEVQPGSGLVAFPPPNGYVVDEGEKAMRAKFEEYIGNKLTGKYYVVIDVKNIDNLQKSLYICYAPNGITMPQNGPPKDKDFSRPYYVYNNGKTTITR